MAVNQRNTDSWHLRKEVTVGNLFATIAAIAAVIGAFYNLDSRQSKTELTVAYMQAEMAQDRDDEKEYRKDVRNKLGEIRELLWKFLSEVKGK